MNNQKFLFKHLKSYRKTVVLDVSSFHNGDFVDEFYNVGYSAFRFQMGVAKVHPQDTYSKSQGRIAAVQKIKSYPIKLIKIEINQCDTVMMFQFPFEDEKYIMMLHYKKSGNYHLGSVYKQDEEEYPPPNKALIKAMKDYKTKYGGLK